MAHASAFSASGTDFDTSGFFAGLRRRFDDYVLYRQTLAELSALTARDLRDLNIDQYDLDGTARRAVYGA